ncbi:efflux transporter outer membrane subunit [Phytohalomonas tamaricis]|uniref:efflux transporter outer membrane subunit n=1 Tax=Phytohalomonas tamaricis TaxID=2081032 RepID=UPI0021D438FF|nr:efflux transporter outer membrane subunit [Phytohalomonas tamaricis]
MKKGRALTGFEKSIGHYLRMGGLSAVCGVMLAGCANYAGIEPQGEMTDLAQLNAHQMLSDVTISPASWPKSDWWNALGDPVLDQLIHEALADSPDMEVAQARLRQANAEAEAAGAERLPTVDGSASISRSRVSQVQDPSGVGGFYSTSRALSANFNYDFDLWGRDEADFRAALGEARASEIDYHAAALTLSTNVARAYVQLADAYNQRDLAQEELERAQNVADINRQLGQAGLQNETPQLQSRSSVASSRQALSAAEQTLRSAEIQMAVLLGKGPDRGAEIPRPRVLTPALLALPSNVPAELLGRRPDIVAARWRVEAATQDIKAAKARFYPNLNLSAMIGFQSYLGNYIFSDAAEAANIEPAISLPIFEGGRLRANLERTDASYDLNVAQYNQTLINALGDVTTYITELDAMKSQLKDLEEARKTAQSGFDLAVSRQQAGLENYLTVLSSQQQLLNAEQRLIDFKTRQLDTSIQLVQALGGGFEPESPSHQEGGVPAAPAPQYKRVTQESLTDHS